MEIITSVSNNLVKETVKLQQKKYRELSGKFLLEGFKPVSEANSCKIDIEYVFVNEKKLAEYKFLKEKIIPTNEAILKKISTTDSAPDCVGVAHRRNLSLDKLSTYNKILLLENIKDAGNLGTILRTATAFGIELVILYGDCVDLYNPKVVRSAVGCLWKLPIIEINDLKILKDNFREHSKIATLPRSKKYLHNFTAPEKFVVMFGSEASGLSDDLIEFSNNDVKIEMMENVESLNLSISCGIVLYKLLIN